MRMYLISFSIIVTTAASGCGYDCQAKCLEIEDELKYRHQETGLVDVRDPCDQQELRDAATCEQCEAAFVEVFREIVPVVTCDCVSTSEYEGSAVARLGYYDSSCNLEVDEVSAESCQDYHSTELGDWETCAEQGQT